MKYETLVQVIADGIYQFYNMPATQTVVSVGKTSMSTKFSIIVDGTIMKIIIHDRWLSAYTYMQLT